MRDGNMLRGCVIGMVLLLVIGKPLIQSALRIGRRPSFWSDKLRKYTILVNGKEVGRIREGDVVEVPIGPGPYEVQARIDWCSSPVLRGVVREGELVDIFVSSGSIVEMMRDPTRYLQIELVSG